MTNCVAYLESTLRRVINDMTKQIGNKKRETSDLRQVATGIAHSDFCREALPRLTDLSKRLEDIIIQLRDDIISEDDSGKSQSWADASEYADVRDDIKIRSPSIHEYQEHKDIPTHEYWVGSAKLKVPVVQLLKEIPPSLYYFSGDEVHPPGIYICIMPNIYVQIPFTRVLTEEHRSVPCSLKSTCTDHNCSFAHPGAPFFRVGSTLKCPSVPNYGDIDTIDSDVQEVTLTDIRMLLMNALADIGAVYYWFQVNGDAPKECVMKDIDICD